MAKALFSLLLVAGLGLTGAATYKWYTGNCPFGLCHDNTESASAPVKKSCCSSAASSCCSETGNPDACTGECPSTKETKKDGACCSEGKCCDGKDTAKKDGACCSEGGCCSKDKETTKTEKKDADTPK